MAVHSARQKRKKKLSVKSKRISATSCSLRCINEKYRTIMMITLSMSVMNVSAAQRHSSSHTFMI